MDANGNHKQLGIVSLGDPKIGNLFRTRSLSGVPFGFDEVAEDLADLFDVRVRQR